VGGEGLVELGGACGRRPETLAAEGEGTVTVGPARAPPVTVEPTTTQPLWEWGVKEAVP
jgi:hypothetical protein